MSLQKYWDIALEKAPEIASTMGSFVVDNIAFVGGASVVIALGYKTLTKSNVAKDYLSCDERHALTYSSLDKAFKKHKDLGSVVLSTGEQLEVMGRQKDGKLYYSSVNMNDLDSRALANKAIYYIDQPEKFYEILSKPEDYPVTKKAKSAMRGFFSSSWTDNLWRRAAEKAHLGFILKADGVNREILEKVAKRNVAKVNDLAEAIMQDNLAIGSYSTLSGVHKDSDGKFHIVVMPLNDLQSKPIKQLNRVNGGRNDILKMFECLWRLNEEKGLSKPEVELVDVANDDEPPCPAFKAGDLERFPTLKSKGFIAS